MEAKSKAFFASICQKNISGPDPPFSDSDRGASLNINFAYKKNNSLE